MFCVSVKALYTREQKESGKTNKNKNKKTKTKKKTKMMKQCCDEDNIEEYYIVCGVALW